MRTENAVNVAQVAEFDEVIDVRSPAEFAEDHVPGARSMPVLDDAERARVGTLYKQVSAFEARKVGAALTARNIAAHIERELLDRPKGWRPLVYCWRGGNRSASMAHVLREVGWQAATLEGGYRAYRRTVIADLASLPPPFPLARRLRPHRQWQEPSVARHWETRGHRCSISRPWRATAARSWGTLPEPAATTPEVVREPRAPAAHGLRSGATRVRRGGEPENRLCFRAGDADREHSRR